MLKFFANKLDMNPITANRNGRVISGWFKFFKSYLFKINCVAKYKNISPQIVCKKIICGSTWGYIPLNLKKGVAANITHVAIRVKIKGIIWLIFKIENFLV